MGAVAGVSGDGIATDAGVLTGSADAVVDVDVTLFARESRRTDALVAVDHVRADAAVDARRRRALVDVHLAVHSRVTYITIAQSVIIHYSFIIVVRVHATSLIFFFFFYSFLCVSLFFHDIFIYFIIFTNILTIFY